MNRKSRLLILLLTILLFLFPLALAQSPGQVQFPTAPDTAATLIEVKDNAKTVLSLALSSSATTMKVVSTASFPATGLIWINGREIATYTSKTANTFTGCLRGQFGTPALVHASGVTIEQRISAANHSALSLAARNLQAKIGSGASQPSAGKIFKGLSAGVSGWEALTNADVVAALGFTPEISPGNLSLASYASLSAAVTAIGTTQATLEIPAPTTVTSSLTVPTNITLLMVGTGLITVSSGQTLTINGPIQASLRQIFTGAGSVRFGQNNPTAHVRWFGAVLDGATDDQAAIQRAIDAFKPVGSSPRGGDVFITGPAAIGSTLLISDTNVRLRGNGWGASQSGERATSYLKWIGSAGTPMVLIHALGARVESLHFIGKSAAKPSAAIEISETSVFCDATGIKDVWIGPMFGFDDDNVEQFTRGIHFSGTLDSDTNYLERVFIVKCGTGIDITNPNAGISHFNVLQTTECGTGVKTVAPSIAITNWICAINDVDLELAAQGVDVTLRNYVSEGSGRMALSSSTGPFRLVVDGGGFQADGAGKFATGAADYSGKRAFVRFTWAEASTDPTIGTYIEIRNFNLQQINSPAVPVIQFWDTGDNTTAAGSTQLHLKLDSVRGITSANIDVGNDGLAVSSRVVELNRQASNSPVAPQFTRFIQNSPYGSEDGVFEDLRFDFVGKINDYGGPLKVKALVTPQNLTVTPTGSGATTYSYRVSALTLDGGETLASTAVTCVNNATLSGGVFNQVAFYPVVGASSYRVYGRTAGSELLLKTMTVAEVGDQSQVIWWDTGALTPSGALPVANTTGNATVDGSMKIGGGAAVRSILSGQATLDFGNTAAQSSGDLTVTVTGAAVGDVVSLGVPHGSVASNSCFTAWVSGNNTVTVRFNNYSAGAIDPASGTFRVQVTRF